jgi:hypothetical protein
MTAGPRRGLVFISCGQVTTQEKKLGQDSSELVARLTPHEPYFAQNQNSLDGFTRNILGALNRAVAMIGIMHPRGTVALLNGESKVRASVWVEQEIAVAAFIEQILGRPLKIALYIHDSICLEGMREQLLLNAVRFRDESEVLQHLSRILPEWRELSPKWEEENALDEERKNQIFSLISQLDPSKQAALKLLLLRSSMTEMVALQTLKQSGVKADYGMFDKLQRSTNLVRPVPGQLPTKRPVYDQHWEITPEIVPLVQRYFIEHQTETPP